VCTSGPRAVGVAGVVVAAARERSQDS
jgi:hypothetical protein